MKNIKYFRYILFVILVNIIELKGEPGAWSDWSPLSRCSVTCGNGTTFRTRTCDSSQKRLCPGLSSEAFRCSITCPKINGSWSEWSNFSTCSETCGTNVTQLRTRTCTKPQPSFGGEYCNGSQVDYRNCNLSSCPINGSWTEWSEFSGCNASCSAVDSKRLRTRNCTNPPPSDGGNVCEGSPVEYADCNSTSCDKIYDANFNGNLNGDNAIDVEFCDAEENGCEHMCAYDSRRKPICFCSNGYTRRADNKTCQDVNECESSESKCDGLCINYEGSYMCLCRDPATYWDVEKLICAVNDEK